VLKGERSSADAKGIQASSSGAFRSRTDSAPSESSTASGGSSGGSAGASSSSSSSLASSTSSSSSAHGKEKKEKFGLSFRKSLARVPTLAQSLGLSKNEPSDPPACVAQDSVDSLHFGHFSSGKLHSTEPQHSQADIGFKTVLYGWGSLRDHQDVISFNGFISCSFKERIVQVSAGASHALLLTDQWRVYSLGTGSRGELGLGEGVRSIAEPAHVRRLADKAICHVQAGSSISAAISSQGELFLFGKQGLLAEDTFTPVLCPGLVGKTVRAVAFGEQHALALVEVFGVWGHHNLVFSWGDNSHFQLGLGNDTRLYVEKPTMIPRLRNKYITQVSAGRYHSCALSVMKKVYVWGQIETPKEDADLDLLGVPGGGSTLKRPHRVPLLRSPKQVHCGGGFVLVKCKRGVYVWGQGLRGELGVGSRTRLELPTRLDSLSGHHHEMISLGVEHCLVLTASEKPVLFTWGAVGTDEDCEMASNKLLRPRTRDLLEPKSAKGFLDKNMLIIEAGPHISFVVLRERIRDPDWNPLSRAPSRTLSLLTLESRARDLTLDSKRRYTPSIHVPSKLEISQAREMAQRIDDMKLRGQKEELREYRQKILKARGSIESLVEREQALQLLVSLQGMIHEQRNRLETDHLEQMLTACEQLRMLLSRPSPLLESADSKSLSSPTLSTLTLTGSASPPQSSSASLLTTATASLSATLSSDAEQLQPQQQPSSSTDPATASQPSSVGSSGAVLIVVPATSSADPESQTQTQSPTETPSHTQSQTQPKRKCLRPHPNQRLSREQSFATSASLSPSQSHTPAADALKVLESTSPSSSRSSASSSTALKLSSGDFVRSDTAYDLDPEEIVWKDRLDAGAGGVVFSGTWRSQPVAIKVLKHFKSQQLQDFHEELGILREIRSPHIVYFYGICKKPDSLTLIEESSDHPVCLVMEYCANGGLDSYLKKCSHFGWDHFFRFGIRIATAISALHNWRPQIVHRDLKTPNILVDENENIRLADFGLARFTKRRARQGVNTQTWVSAPLAAELKKLRGTYLYMCPELYLGSKGPGFTVKSDVFAIALILWELLVKCLTGVYETPYSDQRINVMALYIQVSKNNLRCTFPDRTPPVVKSLIERAWATDPSERPTSDVLAEELKQTYESYRENRSEWDALRTSKKATEDDDPQSSAHRSTVSAVRPDCSPTCTDRSEHSDACSNSDNEDEDEDEEEDEEQCRSRSGSGRSVGSANDHHQSQSDSSPDSDSDADSSSDADEIGAASAHAPFTSSSSSSEFPDSDSDDEEETTDEEEDSALPAGHGSAGKSNNQELHLRVSRLLMERANREAQELELFSETVRPTLRMTSSKVRTLIRMFSALDKLKKNPENP